MKRRLEGRGGGQIFPFILGTRQSSGDVGGNPHADDLVGILHWFAPLDLVDMFHTFNDMPPHGILPIEERGIVEANEKLAVGAVGV